ncbi:MAG TPA: DUF1801 domain-containing protein [Thermoplasmata archaeon]|nr:DUF1801 domain-containing protein [Thermoplasmata archaeon]
MPSTSGRSEDVDKLLAAIEPPQREVARALRDLVLETGPDLQEKVIYGVPWYRGKSYVCAIAAHSDHTNLEFYRGTSLRDPTALLEGTGKNLRHVKVYAVGEVRRPRLRALLREAIALDAA